MGNYLWMSKNKTIDEKSDPVEEKNVNIKMELICSLELIYLFDKNNQYIKEKIMETIQKSPSLTDKEGFVYGFFSPHDRNLRDNFWMKLGRTEKENPEERVREWGGTMIFCQKCSYNRRFERLVHLFFAFANQHRILTKDGIFVNIIDPKIDQNQNENEDDVNNNHNDHIKKEIEWFHFTERINICKYVSLIQELIENLYNCSINEIKEVKKNIKNNKISKIVCNEIKKSDDDGKNNQKEKNQIKDTPYHKIAVKININTASQIELEKISGIGPKLATNIIQYRKTNGNFVCLEDIKKVKGIGSKKLQDIHKFIQI